MICAAEIEVVAVPRSHHVVAHDAAGWQALSVEAMILTWLRGGIPRYKGSVDWFLRL